jgi:hypothetical protein
MKTIRSFFLLLFFISLSAHAAGNTLVFSPIRGAKTEITIKNQTLAWTTSYHGRNNKGRIDVDTEKQIHIVVDDYDFSGRRGFAVWHTDDGMGTYSIHRIFTFSPKTNKFIERNPASQCGDEFINLIIDRKNKRLLSTSWDQNIPRQCITHLSILN